MKKRLAVTLIGAALASLVGVVPASARSDTTISVTCEKAGFANIVDANALFGTTVNTTVYNEVNPFGDTCWIDQ
jgi:hypothetical protein